MDPKFLLISSCLLVDVPAKTIDYCFTTRKLCGFIFTANTCFQTSDMQFGFKQQHSTAMCSLLYHEVINHYLCNGSNVYSCLLDTSKAFDKVHYVHCLAYY